MGPPGVVTGRAEGGAAATLPPPPDRIRCAWARTGLSAPYHDAEWGVPVHDDRVLFELLTLEGAQAGLSWETVLKKRTRYREALPGSTPPGWLGSPPRGSSGCSRT